jgi:hypothetical protein
LIAKRPEAMLQDSRLRTIAISSLAGLLALAALAWIVLRSPDFPLLTASSSGEWITVPIRVDTNAIPVHPDALPIARLARRFALPQAGPLEIRISALRGYEVWLNGEGVGERAPDEGNWKREDRIEILDGLASDNEIRVIARNTNGPALVRLQLGAPGFELSSDASWVAIDSRGTLRPALVADDTRSGAVGLGEPTPWQNLVAHRDRLVLFATICGLLSLWLSKRAVPRPKLLMGAAISLALIFWTAIFAAKSGRIPAYVGYDGPAHLEYVRFLLDNGKLPLPEDGFSMYHPPLFYGIAAAIVALFGGGAGADAASREAAEMMVRVVPVLAGAGQLAVAFALSRRLFPGDALTASLSLLICALLPVNLYMSMYVSNEPLNALLAGCVLLSTTDLLLRDDLPLGRVLGLAALLGLALLTKATSLLLLPLVGLALAFKHLALDRAGISSLAVRIGAGSAALAAVCGWYFVRNLVQLGRPTVGNWNVSYNEVGWFQQPGYHMPSYYFSFGKSLTQPFFAGFHSFWDGLYSTFWGDGLVAGVISLGDRHPLWNYDYMSMTYPLALPATALLLAGIASFGFSRDPNSRRRLALGFLAVTILAYGLAVLVMTLRLPFYAQAKASYALSVVAPTAVAGAYAFARLQRWLAASKQPWLVVLLHAWAGALAIVLGVTFGA